MYMNPELNEQQKKLLADLLTIQSGELAWDYNDMRVINIETCLHNIYTQDNTRHVRKPQTRMNPALNDIVKEELEKLLKVNCIYPISNNKWISPLVVVPKNNG